MDYQTYFKQSIQDPTGFWKTQAAKIDWFTFPKTILGTSSDGIYEWFADGELNMAYLALEYQIAQGRGDQVAIYYDSPVTHLDTGQDHKQSLTFKQLQAEVQKFAGVLKGFGVGKGDVVIIYMPMIPESVVAMLACAYLGAVHSVVFGGFAPHELQIRIDDCKPKVILSATCGIEIKKIINYSRLVNEALKLSQHQPDEIIFYRRPMQPQVELNFKYHDWVEVVNQASPVLECTPVKGNDPLYILYTSGTTAKPKGVIRQVGGHAVSLNFSMKYVYNCEPGDVYWAASDIGWVVGHSYIVYGPLCYGCSTILFEGKPIKTPDPSTFWRIMAEYKVKAFFTAPTAFRAIKKEDPDGDHLKNYDLSNLEAIFLAGERLDPPTLDWLQAKTNKPVYDHWWQTETGAAMVCNPLGIAPQPVKSGSSTLPVPGFQIDILNEEGEILGPNQKGYIAVRLPMPPGCLNTLWNGFDDFHKYYLARFEGYYLTGDEGYMDDEGYVFIMGRVDDVINVAGHRLSTGEMEEIIASHPAIAECVVIGIDDQLKGQIPIGFYILKDNVETSSAEVEQNLIQMVRSQIGAVAVFKTAIQVTRLPKTRSGKILRKYMREISKTADYKIPSTIDDVSILKDIENLMEKYELGRFKS